MSDLDTTRLRRCLDRMVAPWDGPLPGVALGVVRDGALVLRRNAGLASLELGVPIGDATTFRIASVSKQFTCAAILLLAAEGRLAIEDEIRDRVPEFPDLGARITVAHLMHNTSGIRDMLEIMRLGGAHLGQPCTREDLLAGICRQRGLNFTPGSRYLYSNSNFFLLGLIVERAAGEALPAFLERRIFAPLGMTRTRMTESTAEPAPGLATGYFPAPGGGWQRAPHAFPLGGEGGLVSGVEDLALWDRNFATGLVGGAELTAELVRQADFSGGATNSYARGLQVHPYRGVRTESHGGLWPGYKTRFLRAPERGITVVVISNNATSDPYHLAQDVLDLMLDGDPSVHALPATLPADALELWAGRYLDRSSGATIDVERGKDGLVGRTHGVPFRLVPTGDDGFAASQPSANFTARLSADGATLDVVEDAGVRVAFARASGGELPDDIVGTYANDEIGAVWTLAAPGGEMSALTVHVSGPLVTSGGWTVQPVAEDCIRIVITRAMFDAWLDVRVLRDEHDEVTGLHVDGGRARRIVFVRTPSHEDHV